MSLTFPRSLFALLSGLLLAGLVPAAAQADGSPSIAAAPAVAFGQQQFGNTANGSRGNYDLNQYWALSVTAGDAITLDWESNSSPYLLVYPLGTTDFNVEGTSSFHDQTLQYNHRNQLVFTAPRTGVMPLRFAESKPGGRYDFTAYVKHAVRLSLPHTGRLRRKGNLGVSARNAEGGVISDSALQVDVQIKRGRHWLTVGTAPVANSIAAVTLNIPARFAGRKISLRAFAHSDGYISVASRSQRVRVAGRAR